MRRADRKQKPAQGLTEVEATAMILVERHGENALAMAERIEQQSANPDFARAVTDEVRRLQTRH